MRPRIVDALNAWFGTELFAWIVPDPAFVYAIAMATVALVFLRRSHKATLSRYHALGAVVWAIVGGLIGARVFFLLQHLELTVSRPSIVFDLNGGTVSWGAYLGGSLAFIFYLRRHQQPTVRYLDVLASCLGLGPFIARWACFLNGDDYGTLADVPWAVSFPHGSYPFAAQVQAGLLDPLAELSLPIHPVQIYFSFKGLLLVAVCTMLWKRKLSPGILFALYWLMFAAARFVLEFFRGDVSRGFIGVLSVGQVMSLVIFVAAGVMLAFAARQRTSPFFKHDVARGIE